MNQANLGKVPNPPIETIFTFGFGIKPIAIVYSGAQCIVAFSLKLVLMCRCRGLRLNDMKAVPGSIYSMPRISPAVDLLVPTLILFLNLGSRQSLVNKTQFVCVSVNCLFVSPCERTL